LILILHSMRDLGRHRVKHHCSLLSLAPITFDANTFSCYGGSYFATIAVISTICRRPLNWVGPSMPASSPLLITAIIAYCSEYVPLQNCLLPLSSPPPRALQLSTPPLQSSFSELHNTSMGHARLVCTQFSSFLHNSQKVGSYRFLFSPTDRSERSHYCSLLQQHSQ
jgi:hypothetical protein